MSGARSPRRGWRLSSALAASCALSVVAASVLTADVIDDRRSSPAVVRSPGASDPAQTVRSAPAHYWRADLAGTPPGDLGCTSNAGELSATASAVKAQWGYWDNCGGSVVDIGAEGLPAAPWGGNRAIKWFKPAGDSNVYQKLSRSFSRENWPDGKNVPLGQSPADVSARYIVYKYIPSDGVKLNPRHGWLVLMSFKENYLDSNFEFHQDGIGWKVGCNNFTSGDAGALRCQMTSKRQFALADYTDRWVKWEYRLYQGAQDKTGHGGRMELYADDKLIDIGYEGENENAHVGSAAFSPLGRTQAWVWTAGQYTSNQVTDGVPDFVNTTMTSYVGLSAVLPLID
jgi:hypothetical protein